MSNLALVTIIFGLKCKIGVIIKNYIWAVGLQIYPVNLPKIKKDIFMW